MKCWKRITFITESNSIRRRKHECIIEYWRREHERVALWSWNDQDQHQHWTECSNKHSWSRRSRCVYQVHMLTAWHQNWDLQWHDSDVKWCQQDQHWIESYQHWVESYADNIEYCSNAFTERNEEKNVIIHHLKVTSSQLSTLISKDQFLKSIKLSDSSLFEDSKQNVNNWLSWM